jgi:hypothetical protein
LAKIQSQVLAELTCNTLEHNEKNKENLGNIKGQLHNRLDAIDTSIVESMDQTKLLSAMEKIDKHVVSVIHTAVPPIPHVDADRLNQAYEYMCTLVKDVISKNEDFEERVIVPVSNISHLVKSNEALVTKVEKLSEEKRDAVKQLSNMMKASSNSTLHKTSFTNTSSITELKSKLAKSESQLMKSREEQSLLRRQVDAKDKKLEKLLRGSPVMV